MIEAVVNARPQEGERRLKPPALAIGGALVGT
jgi:hypothetical protein